MRVDEEDCKGLLGSQLDDLEVYWKVTQELQIRKQKYKVFRNRGVPSKVP